MKLEQHRCQKDHNLPMKATTSLLYKHSHGNQRQERLQPFSGETISKQSSSISSYGFSQRCTRFLLKERENSLVLIQIIIKLQAAE